MTRKRVKKAEACISIKFRKTKLLEEALTHSSATSSDDELQSNERLEFLGDSVLSVVVTDFLFRRFPELREGDLAKIRGSLVKADELAAVSRKLGLGDCLILGKGAEVSAARERISILEAGLEAVIGAIYLDRGLKKAKEFILEHFEEKIVERAVKREYFDFKTLLQELTMQLYGKTPRYRLIKQIGPVHDKTFFVEVLVDRKACGEGSGKSKKQAEQEAARQARDSLSLEHKPSGS